MSSYREYFKKLKIDIEKILSHLDFIELFETGSEIDAEIQQYTLFIAEIDFDSEVNQEIADEIQEYFEAITKHYRDIIFTLTADDDHQANKEKYKNLLHMINTHYEPQYKTEIEILILRFIKELSKAKDDDESRILSVEYTHEISNSKFKTDQGRFSRNDNIAQSLIYFVEQYLIYEDILKKCELIISFSDEIDTRIKEELFLLRLISIHDAHAGVLTDYGESYLASVLTNYSAEEQAEIIDQIKKFLDNLDSKNDYKDFQKIELSLGTIFLFEIASLGKTIYASIPNIQQYLKSQMGKTSGEFKAILAFVEAFIEEFKHEFTAQPYNQVKVDHKIQNTIKDAIYEYKDYEKQHFRDSKKHQRLLKQYKGIIQKVFENPKIHKSGMLIHVTTKYIHALRMSASDEAKKLEKILSILLSEHYQVFAMPLVSNLQQFAQKYTIAHETITYLFKVPKSVEKSQIVMALTDILVRMTEDKAAKKELDQFLNTIEDATQKAKTLELILKINKEGKLDDADIPKAAIELTDESKIIQALAKSLFQESFHNAVSIPDPANRMHQAKKMAIGEFLEQSHATEEIILFNLSCALGLSGIFQIEVDQRLLTARQELKDIFDHPDNPVSEKKQELIDLILSYNEKIREHVRKNYSKEHSFIEQHLCNSYNIVELQADLVDILVATTLELQKNKPNEKNINFLKELIHQYDLFWHQFNGFTAGDLYTSCSEIANAFKVSNLLFERVFLFPNYSAVLVDHVKRWFQKQLLDLENFSEQCLHLITFAKTEDGIVLTPEEIDEYIKAFKDLAEGKEIIIEKLIISEKAIIGQKIAREIATNNLIKKVLEASAKAQIIDKEEKIKRVFDHVQEKYGADAWNLIHFFGYLKAVNKASYGYEDLVELLPENISHPTSALIEKNIEKINEAYQKLKEERQKFQAKEIPAREAYILDEFLEEKLGVDNENTRTNIVHDLQWAIQSKNNLKLWIVIHEVVRKNNEKKSLSEERLETQREELFNQVDSLYPNRFISIIDKEETTKKQKSFYNPAAEEETSFSPAEEKKARPMTAYDFIGDNFKGYMSESETYKQFINFCRFVHRNQSGDRAEAALIAENIDQLTELNPSQIEKCRLICKMHNVLILRLNDYIQMTSKDSQISELSQQISVLLKDKLGLKNNELSDNLAKTLVSGKLEFMWLQFRKIVAEYKNNLTIQDKKDLTIQDEKDLIQSINALLAHAPISFEQITYYDTFTNLIELDANFFYNYIYHIYGGTAVSERIARAAEFRAFQEFIYKLGIKTKNQNYIDLAKPTYHLNTFDKLTDEQKKSLDKLLVLLNKNFIQYNRENRIDEIKLAPYQFQQIMRDVLLNMGIKDTETQDNLMAKLHNVIKGDEPGESGDPIQIKLAINDCLSLLPYMYRRRLEKILREALNEYKPDSVIDLDDVDLSPDKNTDESENTGEEPQSSLEMPELIPIEDTSHDRDIPPQHEDIIHPLKQLEEEEHELPYVHPDTQPGQPQQEEPIIIEEDDSEKHPRLPGNQNPPEIIQEEAIELTPDDIQRVFVPFTPNQEPVPVEEAEDHEGQYIFYIPKSKTGNKPPEKSPDLPVIKIDTPIIDPTIFFDHNTQPSLPDVPVPETAGALFLTPIQGSVSPHQILRNTMAQLPKASEAYRILQALVPKPVTAGKMGGNHVLQKSITSYPPLKPAPAGGTTKAPKVAKGKGKIRVNGGKVSAFIILWDVGAQSLERRINNLGGNGAYVPTFQNIDKFLNDTTQGIDELGGLNPGGHYMPMNEIYSGVSKGVQIYFETTNYILVSGSDGMYHAVNAISQETPIPKEFYPMRAFNSVLGTTIRWLGGDLAREKAEMEAYMKKHPIITVESKLVSMLPAEAKFLYIQYKQESMKTKISCVSGQIETGLLVNQKKNLPSSLLQRKSIQLNLQLRQNRPATAIRIKPYEIHTFKNW